MVILKVRKKSVLPTIYSSLDGSLPCLDGVQPGHALQHDGHGVIVVSNDLF